MTGNRAGFGLYVHWPFCQSKCPYCDFNSHVSNRVEQRAWSSAFVSEIERVGAETQDRVLNSIFFGGGTPSLMDPNVVDQILQSARATWRFANDIEITLEANPTSVESARFQSYRDAGVNRVSVGLQALRDEDLRRLGRTHTVAEGKIAVETAKSIFPRVSFDLIYARQDQCLSSWQRELEEALEFATDHISLYQLTIEPGTVFGRRHELGKLSGLPEDDLAADMFHLTQEMTAKAGLQSYEISNHARPGAESLHNLIYWNSGDWVGIGPGAHGRITLGEQRIATETLSLPSKWLGAVQSGAVCETRTLLSSEESYEEAVMMGLRLNAGIRADLVPQVAEKIIKINNLGDSHLLETVDNQLCLTPSGRPVLNAVLRELLV